MKSGDNKDLAVVILAAGKGSRMASDLPKVLHKIAHKPMIHHVLAAAAALDPDRVICVIGPDMPDLEQAVKPYQTVIQSERLGTGHAVQQAMPLLRNFKGDVLVLYGDTPLITSNSLTTLRDAHKTYSPAISIMGMHPPDPSSYGRLIMRDSVDLDYIIEHKDADEAQRAVTFCNSGIMLIDGSGLDRWLAQLTNTNAQGEYYLTDLPAVAAKEGGRSIAIDAPYQDMLGVNTLEQLAACEAAMQNRLRSSMMTCGVTFYDPGTVYLAADTQIGGGTVIEPNVFIGPDVHIGKDVRIKAFTHIEGPAQIGNASVIGPFARIRPQSMLADQVEIGNFVEINRSSIGTGSKAKHLAYLGDTEAGAKVNIGAGTITANYDGVNKHKTKLGNAVSTGANSTLIAPLTVADHAYIAADTTVIGDVSAGALVYTPKNKQVEKSRSPKKPAERLSNNF